MSKRVKRFIYQISKRLGFFALARRLTAKELRILCYHGLSIGDEYLYMPGLFMRPETVRTRLHTLTRHRYPVLPLSQALEHLRNGTLPPCTVVITFDDGFYGNYHCGIALFDEFPLAATIYVTTYYVMKQTPVFRHVVQYMFWKTDRNELVLEGLPGFGGGVLDLTDEPVARRMMWDLILKAETDLKESERVTLGHELGVRLGVDFDELVRTRRLSLMTPNEIRSLAELGMDIQLHTHRHQFLPNKEHVQREIMDNRAVLEPLVGWPCVHLCYPSGVFTPVQWPWLQEAGIASATTCEPGLNNIRTHPYGLRRFVDAETVTTLEFEAEISGFSELLRRLVGRKARSSVPPLAHSR